MISIVINADTRSGYLTSSRGDDWGKASLCGVRSIDFLTEGAKQKINFFKGHEIQLVLYVDKHEELSYESEKEIRYIINRVGNNSKFVFKEHSRTDYKWNDKIYIEALKLADGDYVCHIDQDANCYRRDESDIVDAYIDLLESYKYICQPWDGVGDEMYHASTRFFICKKQTLDEAFKEDLLINPLRGIHNPCLEHSLGIVAGKGNVLYPQREDDNYIIFSWATYNTGTLKRLNELSYEKTKEYIVDKCGLHGPNDCVDNLEKFNSL